MIVVDTSAIVAVLREEAEGARFTAIIGEADACFFSAVNLFEASMVMIGRNRPELALPLDRLMRELPIEIVPFDEDLARESRAAFIRFPRLTYAIARLPVTTNIIEKILRGELAYPGQARGLERGAVRLIARVAKAAAS